MSSRRTKTDNDNTVEKMRNEIESLKQAQVAISATQAGSPLSFDDLSHTEQACASLGVGPEEFRPLGWLNNGHFDALLKNNQMDDTLVRRLEAYKVVAERG